MALEWLSPSHEAVAKCTDSHSLLKAIQSDFGGTSDLRRMLDKQAGKTTLLRMPGHCGVAGNEEADAFARQTVALTDGAPRPVSVAAASVLIRQTLKDPPPTHCRAQVVYTKAFHGWLIIGPPPRQST